MKEEFSIQHLQHWIKKKECQHLQKKERQTGMINDWLMNIFIKLYLI